MRSGDSTGEQASRSMPGADLVALYRAHVDEVYRYLSRLTAGDTSRSEDLTQVVFERVAGVIGAGREIPTSVGAWLIAVARNEFLQSARHDGRERRRLERVAAWPSSSDGSDIVVERRLLLRQLMADLTDEQRAALVFRYHDDLALRDVAALLGRSIEATESLLARARRRARDHGEGTTDGQ